MSLTNTDSRVQDARNYNSHGLQSSFELFLSAADVCAASAVSATAAYTAATVVAAATAPPATAANANKPD